MDLRLSMRVEMPMKDQLILVPSGEENFSVRWTGLVHS